MTKMIKYYTIMYYKYDNSGTQSNITSPHICENIVELYEDFLLMVDSDYRWIGFMPVRAFHIRKMKEPYSVEIL